MKPSLIRFVFTLYLSALTVFCATAQELDFVKTMGGAGDDGLYDLVTDNDKNIYVIGWFSITCDLDPGAGTSLMASNGNRDITLAKYDSVGNYLWGFSLGSSGQDEGSVITLDSAGNIIIAGRFVSSVDFDPGPAVNLHLSQGNRDIFLAKYSPSGSLLWASHFGSTGYDDAEEVITDSAGNIYLGGSFQNTVDFNYGPGVWNVVSNGWDDAYVAKFGPAGTLLWVRSFGGFDGDDLSGMDLDGKGALYCSGLFSGLTDFDGGAGVAFTTATGLSDAFLVKYNTDGDFQWVKTAGSAGIDGAYGLEVSESSIYVSGNFSQTLDFDPGAGLAMRSSMGATDAFLWNLDTMGNFSWVNTYGGTANDVGLDVCVDLSGKIINMGLFRQLVQFQGTTNTFNLQAFGDIDIYVSNTTSSGLLESVFQIGSSGFENGHTLKTAGNSAFYISGLFGGTTDFDPDSVNIQSAACAGVNDMFFARYRFDCMPPPLVISFDTICFGEFYVVGGNAYGLPGTYLDTLVAVGGCDSLVETHLTINPKSDFVSFRTICAGDSLIINGHVYTTDGIYIDTLVNTYGCDSLVTTHLTVQSLVTVNNPVSICSGGFYVVGNHVYTQPGLYADTLQSVTGCDSVVNTFLAVNYTYLNTQVLSICDGDTYFFNNNLYSVSGIYLDTLNSVYGCDSVIITDLTVSSLDTQVVLVSGTYVAMQSGVNYQWFSCDSGQIIMIPGATSQVFVPASPGNYFVLIESAMGCKDSSACLSSVNVGLIPFLTRLKMEVFPNPTRGNLIINSDLDITEVRLFSSVGICLSILKPEANYTKMELNIEQYPSGFYLVEVHSGLNSKRFRIVKSE